MIVPGPLTWRRLTVAAISAFLVAYLGIRGAGYDAIVRQEFGIAIWCLIAFGLIAGIFPRGRLTPLAIAPVLALAGLALLTLLSTAWTNSDERTYTEFTRVLIFSGTLALAVLALNRHTWQAAGAGLTAGAVVVCAVAVASRLAPGTFPDHDIALAFDTDRLSYPLDYWNAVAAWGAASAAMTLGWSANLRVRWARAATLAAVPLATTAVYLTYSRAGVIGIVVGTCAVIALSRNRWTAAAHTLAAGAATGLTIAVIRAQPAIADATGTEGAGTVALALIVAMAGCALVALATSSVKLDRVRLPREAARVAVPVAVVVGVIGVITVARGDIAEAWDEFQNQRTVAVGDDPTARLTTAGGTRREVWDSALEAFESDPVLGIGAGTFESWWSRNGGPEFMRDAHSLYLEQLAELGILGILCLVATFGLGVALAVRARLGMRRSTDIAAATALTAGTVVYLAHAGVDWMWEETAVTVLAVASMGAMLAASSERTGKRYALRPGVRPLLAIVAIAAALSQIPALVSTARVRDSAEALSEQRLADARELADDAIEAQPWAATPYASRAAVEARSGDFDSARADIQEAIDREPDNWRHRLALAQIELAEGRPDAARAAFADLRDLSLTSAVPHRSASALARDPAIRMAAKRGCLAFRFGACGVQARATPARCLPPGGAYAAIRDVRGPEVESIQVVKVPILNSDPVYYVAGEVDGASTTWALDSSAYRTGLGAVIPLNEAARRTSTLGRPVDPSAFGLSPSDEGAAEASACRPRR